MTRSDKRKREAGYIAGSMALCNMGAAVFDNSLLPTVALFSLSAAVLWVLCPQISRKSKHVPKEQDGDDSNDYVLV